MARAYSSPGDNRVTRENVKTEMFGLAQRGVTPDMSGEESRMQIAEVQDVRTRIQLVFMEMPELGLTRHQIRRLLNLPIEAC